MTDKADMLKGGNEIDYPRKARNRSEIGVAIVNESDAGVPLHQLSRRRDGANDVPHPGISGKNHWSATIPYDLRQDSDEDEQQGFAVPGKKSREVLEFGETMKRFAWGHGDRIDRIAELAVLNVGGTIAHSEKMENE